MSLLTTAVQVRDLTVRLGGRTVLDRIDLELDTGVYALLGPNGAGKTTLLRVLATVARPTSGLAMLVGHSLGGRGDLREPRRNLGYLPQEFHAYPWFTVAEFVQYMAWLRQLPAGQVPVAVDRALQRTGLADHAGARLRTLSGGLLRRVGIAQAIVHSPRVLLLDEPTAALDPEERVRLWTLLRELGQDSTVLVSTHLVEDMAVGCTGVVVLSQGRVAFDGGPADLADQGAEHGDGSRAERGYAAVLRRAGGKGGQR